MNKSDIAIKLACAAGAVVCSATVLFAPSLSHAAMTSVDVSDAIAVASHVVTGSFPSDASQAIAR